LSSSWPGISLLNCFIIAFNAESIFDLTSDTSCDD
jgi:hypothetical protein